MSNYTPEYWSRWTLQRVGDPCECCGTRHPKLERDHKHPRFEGGTDEPENIWRICPNCHAIKTSQERSRAGKGRVPHNKGKLLTEEHKRKISEGLTGKPSPMRGKKASEETRRKLSEAHKGRIFSEETRRKISEAAKGNTRWLGHKHTEDAKRKISEARKARCVKVT